MPTPEELLAKAQKPAEEALRFHAYYKGKIQTAPKCPIRGIADFSIWYTPGVAAPCRAIQAQPDLVCEHTNKANTIFRAYLTWNFCYEVTPPALHDVKRHKERWDKHVDWEKFFWEE